MLTYQLNKFSLRFKNKGEMEVPASFELSVELGPRRLFGLEKGLIRAAFAGFNKTTDLLVDFNKGQQGALNILDENNFVGGYKVKEFTSPDGAIIHKEYDVSLRGNVLNLKFQCDDEESFGGFLYLARYLIPASLSLELCEPIYVEKVSGSCNKREFDLRLSSYGNFMTLIRPGDIEKCINKAFVNVETVRFAHSVRLKAALHYYHAARRLIEAGDNVWEFTAEILLNYYKVLEALFGNSRDSIRKEMKLLGYETEQVESVFIPITLLRNQFDIAHVRLSSARGIEPVRVTKYILILESRVGELIKRVLDKCKRGEYRIIPDNAEQGYSDDDQREWDQINESIGRAFFGNSEKEEKSD